MNPTNSSPTPRYHTGDKVTITADDHHGQDGTVIGMTSAGTSYLIAFPQGFGWYGVAGIKPYEPQPATDVRSAIKLIAEKAEARIAEMNVEIGRLYDERNALNQVITAAEMLSDN